MLNIGYYFDDKESYQESLNYYLKAIELYKSVNDEIGVADCYSYIGYSFSYLNSIENSFKYYVKALDIYLKLNDSVGMADVYTGFGNLYYDQENYNRAEDYYSKSLAIYKALKDTEGILSSYIDLGNAISEKGAIDQGLDYYFKSIELSDELDDFEGLAVNYANIGECYLDQGEYKNALHYLNKSIEISDKNNYKLLYPLVYSNIANAYLKLKQYHKVILYANKSIATSRNVHWTNMEYDAHSHLSAANEELGNYKKALQNHKLFKKFTDSIYTLKKVEQVTKLDVLQTLEDKEKQIDAIEENEEVKSLQLKTQQLFSFALIIFSLFSIGLIVNLYKQRKKRKVTYNLLSIEKQKAEDSDRLKSAFLANMSHEIRTPMNAIMGFSNFLKNPNLKSEKRNHFIDIINISGERLMAIINDIIDISKIESNQLKTESKRFNFELILNEIIEIQKETNNLVTKKELIFNLITSQPFQDNFIVSDENRFSQIINNLISNAVKFSLNQGIIEIGYYLKHYNTKPYIEFYVKDTGKGIPKSKFRLIFERFSQAGDNDFKVGNGLGLSICKGLVTLLNGEIWLESEENKGTTFYFTLPY